MASHDMNFNALDLDERPGPKFDMNFEIQLAKYLKGRSHLASYSQLEGIKGNSNILDSLNMPL